MDNGRNDIYIHWPKIPKGNGVLEDPRRRCKDTIKVDRN
jgi:hypothetical protein